MIEVTQADRDAAADYLDATGVDWGACGDVRHGRVEHPAVQAFARHRTTAEAARDARDAKLAQAKEALADMVALFTSEGLLSGRAPIGVNHALAGARAALKEIDNG